jgi:hypothetical protein
MHYPENGPKTPRGARFGAVRNSTPAMIREGRKSAQMTTAK